MTSDVKTAPLTLADARCGKEQTVKRTHTQNQGRFNVHGSPECYQNQKERHTILSRFAIASLLLGIFAITGCVASTARMGVFPMDHQDGARIASDKLECEEQAKGITGQSTAAEAATGAAVGIGVGAIVGGAAGALLGAFISSPGEGAAAGAAIGAFFGGLQGAGGGAETNRQVFLSNYEACLRARQYSVAR
jgi:Glycine-zipper domain